MTTTYMLCKLLIQLGRTTGLIEKMDAYLAVDRITAAEYAELAAMITA